jgi:hypothetical protein
MERPHRLPFNMAPSIVHTYPQRPSTSHTLRMPTPDLHYSSMRPVASFRHQVTPSPDPHQYPTPLDAAHYTERQDTSAIPPTEFFRPLPQAEGLRRPRQLPESYYNLPSTENCITVSAESLCTPPLEAPYLVTQFGPHRQRPSRVFLTDCPFSRFRADNPNVPLCKKVQKKRHAVI